MATNVGEISSTPISAHVLQFDIVNERGVQLRAMIWGELASHFLNKRQTINGDQVIILTIMQPKEFRGDSYLTSTLATQIYTEDEIPHISEFQERVWVANRYITPLAPVILPDRDNSLTRILYLGRAHKAGGNKKTATLNCLITIKRIQEDKPWFYFWCGVCSCTKGVDEVGGVVWCGCCEDICAVPLARLRLHVEVTDGNTTVAVVVPDEAAEALIGIPAATLVNNYRAGDDVNGVPLEIKFLADTRHVFELKSHTYIDHGQYESFVCSAIIKTRSHDQLGVMSLTHNGAMTPYAMTATGMLNTPYNPTRQLRVDEMDVPSTSATTHEQQNDSSDEN